MIRHFMIHTIILMCLLTAAYGRPATIELNTTSTGNQTCEEAMQWIEMLPNFNYTAPSENMFIAKILKKDSIINPNNQLIDPNPPNEADHSSTVGYTDGYFDISSMGSTTYNVPIKTPLGIAGLEPGLSIVYNSHCGEGLLGIGWNISGISSITRIGKNKYFDNETLPVSFTNDDRFVLDGNRMLCDVNYGAYNSEYRLADNNFSKISAKGDINSGIQWFEVTTKEGYVIEYGRTNDSRIEAQGKTKILLWNINKIYDKNGNYVEYSYYEDHSKGEFYPKKISYTGNSEKPLSPPHTILFFYKEKTDKKSGYVSGSIIEQNYVLSHIEIKSEQQIISVPLKLGRC